MYPYIHIGSLELPVYGLIILISYIVGLIICAPIGEKYGIEKKYIISSGSFAAGGALIGSKVLYLITILPDFIINYSSTYTDYSTMDIIVHLLGGYVFYGGLLGAIAGVLIFCQSFNFHKGSLLNILTPLIPFVHSFGRIGCFFGGCCYGIEYSGFLSINFPYNPLSPELNLVSRFPVQLLEALINFILFIFLYIYTKKNRPAPGKSLGIYLMCYSVIRFTLEFFRGDIIRGFFLGISTSQWISLILLPVGFYIFKRANKHYN